MEGGIRFLNFHSFLIFIHFTVLAAVTYLPMTYLSTPVICFPVSNKPMNALDVILLNAVFNARIVRKYVGYKYMANWQL